MDKLNIKPWSGRDLSGPWHFTIKIDGFRLHRDSSGEAVTRGGGVIHGLPAAADGVNLAEIYCESWGESIARHRAKGEFYDDDIYPLDPIDPRLHIGHYTDPSANLIRAVMDLAISCGAEGLVLRQGDRWLKVKKKQTVDLVVVALDIDLAGRLVAFITSHGRIGNMPAAARWQYNDPVYIGSVIECGCTEITPAGKLRHGYLIRHRPDR